jgi:hypothetical protein
MPLRTVGWLVREDADSISVAMERADTEETFRNISCIPRVNIRRIRRLR